MQLTIINVLLLFAAFCLVQFAFNILWKVFDMKLTMISTQSSLIRSTLSSAGSYSTEKRGTNV